MINYDNNKYFFYRSFKESPEGINFAKWMIYGIPLMLIMGFLTWLWLQILYMGLFRPKSKDAEAVNIGAEGERIAANVIDSRYKELGPMTWHESCVGVLFIVVVFLWFFKKPDFIPGWADLISPITNLHPKYKKLFIYKINGGQNSI